MKATSCPKAATLVGAFCLGAISVVAGAAAAENENRASSTHYVFRDSTAIGAPVPEMVLVSAGKFHMGDAKGPVDEQPVHEVSIPQAFAMGRYEITVGEFREFVKATHYKTDAERGNGCNTYSGPEKSWSLVPGSSWQSPSFDQDAAHPVVCVSWNDAIAYTRWLSKQTGEHYRLPTEAEWEYAARAGTDTNYWWGSKDECDNANCCKTGTTWLTKQTRPVGSLAANPFGLYDTAGNVWEWTASEYVSQYVGKETQAASADELSAMRVVRGGSWYNFAIDTRAGMRGKNWPQERYSTIGFRVVRDATPEFVKNAQRQLNSKVSVLSTAN